MSEVQASTAPVVATEGDVDRRGARGKSKLLLIIAAAAVLVGVIWGIAGSKRAAPRQKAVAATPQTKEEAPRVEVPAQAPVAAQPAKVETPKADPPTNPEPEKPAAAAASAEPAADAPEVTKVRIEVIPTDSTVALYGKEIDGPWAFNVPKGKKIVLEVAHPGYVTRRIVLDGKKTFLRIAMTPNAPKVAPANAMPESATGDARKAEPAAAAADTPSEL